jgi:hypothetical protein
VIYDSGAEIGFILESGVFRKAGEYCWPDALENGDVAKPGISLNTSLFVAVATQPEKQFYVYDAKTDAVLKLEDRSRVGTHVGEYQQQGRTLKVMPRDAFSEVAWERVPQEIRGFFDSKG